MYIETNNLRKKKKNYKERGHGLYHIIDEKPKLTNQVCEEIDECWFGNKGIY